MLGGALRYNDLIVTAWIASWFLGWFNGSAGFCFLATTASPAYIIATLSVLGEFSIVCRISVLGEFSIIGVLLIIKELILLLIDGVKLHIGDIGFFNIAWIQCFVDVG